jgi:glycosyltransferase involved in cell wall biosynthesis
MTTWHVLTGEYPPSSGGVGDYTRALACELLRRGHAVHVWSPSVRLDVGDGAIHLHTLPDAFGARARAVLQSGWDARPGTVLLQYVPNALGAGGLNLPFCRWLHDRGSSRDVRVMFHEPYFYFSWNPIGNLRAVVQRLMAKLLVEASRSIYLSTETWRRYLPSSRPAVVLPMPSTIPRCGDAAAVARFRAGLALGSPAELVGHFGTYGDHVTRELEPVVPLVLAARPSAHFVCIGRRGDRFAAALRARHPALHDRIHHTGTLAAHEAAAAIRACDVMVQPYPDGVTTRRTSVMAPLANAVATVSTAGNLTERIWSEMNAVALAPAGTSGAIAAKVVHLLDEPVARAALSQSGRRAYDAHFSIERSVDTLLSPR